MGCRTHVPDSWRCAGAVMCRMWGRRRPLVDTFVDTFVDMCAFGRACAVACLSPGTVALIGPLLVCLSG